MDEAGSSKRGQDVCPSKRNELNLRAVQAQLEQTKGPERYARFARAIAGVEDGE